MSSRVAGLDQNLLEDTRVALRQGAQLASWWKDRHESLSVFTLFESQPQGARVQGFFDQVEIDGAERTAMGCLQRASFQLGESSPLGQAEGFCESLKKHFCQSARWQRGNGLPGGFGYRALAFQKSGNPEAEYFQSAPSTVNFNEVGPMYEWLLLQVDINDFVRSFPPLRPFARFLHRFIREAAFIVSHSDYQTRVLAGESDSVAECRFGYAFVPALVEANHFGFGPGRFGIAIKQFDFRLLESRRLDIHVSFLVTPRSEQVLDFWGVCPVYGLAHLLDRATFGGLGIRERAHDKLDRQMLTQHGRVHNNLLQDMRESFESWPGRSDRTTEGPPTPGMSRVGEV